MKSSSTSLNKASSTGASREAPSRSILDRSAANELIFAVVGPVGSGTSQISKTLATLLSNINYGYHKNDVTILKARTIIEERAGNRGQPIRAETGINYSEELQNAGDLLRKTSNDNAAVAIGFVNGIRTIRAEKQNTDLGKHEPIVPDGTKRAYILDSIRHPDEVALLRRVYQEAFCLIGVFCQEDERLRRLQSKKYRDAGEDKIKNFMQRDENAPEAYGQKVSDAFHLSDYFVDNTVSRFDTTHGGQNKEENPDWDLNDQLGRLVDILTRRRILRPWPGETGMFHAYGARMQSSCLSRQVGAALLDQHGAVVATGTNEVPRAGGGVYGGIHAPNQRGDPDPADDFRCFVHNKYCTNTREQNTIIEDLVSSIDELRTCKDKTDLRKRIRNSRIGQLLEFSRSVHAEMDALLSAGRSGITTVSTHLFVTTFPCHSCARHIVAAGVEEVQYIEPYLKSQAIPLHGDAIVTNPKEWRRSRDREPQHASRPNVLFRAFTGVAPRLYRRAFFKDYKMKDPQSGDMVAKLGPPTGHAIVDMLRFSYPEVEAKLSHLDRGVTSSSK